MKHIADFSELQKLLADASVFKKNTVIVAELVSVETNVATVLSGGTHETTNTALSGDYIITNLTGEHYVLPTEKFESKYNRIIV